MRDEPGFHVPVLPEKRLHVHDQIPDDFHPSQRSNANARSEGLHQNLTSQPVHTIDLHRVTAAYPVAAGAAKPKRSILVPHDLLQRIQDKIGRFHLYRVGGDISPRCECRMG